MLVTCSLDYGSTFVFSILDACGAFSFKPPPSHRKKKVRAMAVSTFLCGLVLRESCPARKGQVLQLHVSDSPNSVSLQDGPLSTINMSGARGCFNCGGCAWCFCVVRFPFPSIFSVLRRSILSPLLSTLFSCRAGLTWTAVFIFFFGCFPYVLPMTRMLSSNDSLKNRNILTLLVVCENHSHASDRAIIEQILLCRMHSRPSSCQLS